MPIKWQKRNITYGTQTEEYPRSRFSDATNQAKRKECQKRAFGIVRPSGPRDAKRSAARGRRSPGRGHRPRHRRWSRRQRRTQRQTGLLRPSNFARRQWTKSSWRRPRMRQPRRRHPPGSSIEVETDVPVEENVETSVTGEEQRVSETTTDDDATQPAAAATEQPTTGESVEVEQAVHETNTDKTAPRPAAAATELLPTGNASAVARPGVDSATALALRRLREKPLCCCGCGGSLSGPKKHFFQGHDGKAKSIVRKIMRGEMKPQDAPVELILRHEEIKFIRQHPEFHSVVDAWRKLRGVPPTNATKQ